MREKKKKQSKKKKTVPKPARAEETLDQEVDVVEAADSYVEGGLKEGLDDGLVTSMIPLEEPGALERISPLQRYLSLVKQHPLLSPDEEMDLAVRLSEKGDIQAAERLVLGNLRLVVKIALEYNRYWQDLLDLIQEGNIGLMQAVKKFDPYRGVKLSTYASYWIRAYILKFIMDNFRLVKIGTTQAQRRLFFNLKKERDKLEAIGFKPSASLLAKTLDVKESEVQEMQRRLGYSEDSLEKPVTEEGEQTLEAVIPDKSPGVDKILAEGQFQEMVKEKLLEFRKSLDRKGMEKEIYIFDHRLLSEEPMTLKDLGEHFSISRERVRQIEKRVLDNLREYLKDELPDFDASDFIATD